MYRIYSLFVVPGMLLASTAQALQAGDPVTFNATDQWVKPGDSLILNIPEPLPSERLAIFLGNTDVTAIFKQSKPGEYAFQHQLFPLSAGEQTLVVYSIHADGNWEEVSQFAVKVLSPGGFEESRITPSLTLNIESQWDEGHSGDTPAPERNKYHDGSLQAGLQTRHAREGLEINSSTNIVGASNEQSRLRFGELESDAPAIDLSDYIVQAQIKDLGLAVGHVNYGENPLLFSSVANRGVLGTYRFNDRFDMGLTWQNGTAIAGYNNLLGLSEGKSHYIAGSTLGWEVFPSGQNPLRVEVSYLRAKIQSLSNFDVGEVTDAEQSRGWGLRLAGQFAQGRLRYSGSFARSRFINPEDPFLSQGTELVPVEETTDDARLMEIAYDLLSNYEQGILGLVTSTLTFTHEKTDPLYRSLGAFPQGDIERNALVLQTLIGVSALTLSYAQAEDNLDNIDNLLKTRTRDTNATLDVPLNEYLGNPEALVQYYPLLSMSAQRVHQYAINNPGTGGDFNPNSHLPDQMNDIARLAMSWSFIKWDFGYELGYSNQDNRQIGRDKSDFEAWSHNINVSLRPIEELSVSFSLGRVDTRDREQKLNTLSDTGSLSIQYLLSSNISLNGNYSKSLDRDTLNLSRAQSDNYDIGLTYRFDAPFIASRTLPGQFFVRYANSDTSNKDNQFGFNSIAGSWALTSGLSINF